MDNYINKKAYRSIYSRLSIIFIIWITLMIIITIITSIFQASNNTINVYYIYTTNSTIINNFRCYDLVNYCFFCSLGHIVVCLITLYPYGQNYFVILSTINSSNSHTYMHELVSKLTADNRINRVSRRIKKKNS